MEWKYYQPNFEYEESLNDVGLHWSGHKNFSYDLVRYLRPRVIVELGTWKGTSLCSFLQAIKDEKCCSVVYAVDTWQGDLHMGKFDKSIFRDVQSLVKKYYSHIKCNLMKMTFDEAVCRFEDQSIDLLHIDGLHTYEAVKNDYLKWINKVSDQGVILFHDIAVKKDEFGVYQFWRELKGDSDNKTIEFLHSFGLGVLLRGGGKFEFSNYQDDFQLHYSLIYEENKNGEIYRLNEINSNNNEKIYRLNEINSLLECEIKKSQNENEILKREIEKIHKSFFWKFLNYFYKLYKKVLKK